MKKKSVHFAEGVLKQIEEFIKTFAPRGYQMNLPGLIRSDFHICWKIDLGSIDVELDMTAGNVTINRFGGKSDIVYAVAFAHLLSQVTGFAASLQVFVDRLKIY